MKIFYFFDRANPRVRNVLFYPFFVFGVLTVSQIDNFLVHYLGFLGYGGNTNNFFPFFLYFSIVIFFAFIYAFIFIALFELLLRVYYWIKNK